MNISYIRVRIILCKITCVHVQVIYLHSVMFELEMIRLNDQNASSNTVNTPSTSTGLDRRGSQGARSILLKGQMRYIEDLKAIIFLCSPL